MAVHFSGWQDELPPIFPRTIPHGTAIVPLDDSPGGREALLSRACSGLYRIKSRDASVSTDSGVGLLSRTMPLGERAMRHAEPARRHLG